MVGRYNITALSDVDQSKQDPSGDFHVSMLTTLNEAVLGGMFATKFAGVDKKPASKAQTSGAAQVKAKSRTKSAIAIKTDTTQASKATNISAAGTIEDDIAKAAAREVKDVTTNELVQKMEAVNLHPDELKRLKAKEKKKKHEKKRKANRKEENRAQATAARSDGTIPKKTGKQEDDTDDDEWVEKMGEDSVQRMCSGIPPFQKNPTADLPMPDLIDDGDETDDDMPNLIDEEDETDEDMPRLISKDGKAKKTKMVKKTGAKGRSGDGKDTKIKQSGLYQRGGQVLLITREG